MPTNTKKRILPVFLPILLILLLGGSAANGQIVYKQPGSFDLHYYYNNWSLEGTHVADNNFSQSAVSLSGFVPLRENFEARYYLASGYNELELAGSKSKLSGLGDLRIQMSHSFQNDRLLLSAGINLPTGKKKLDTDGQLRIIEFLSNDYISVPMRRYGEGLGFNLQAGGAADIGRFKCGLTTVYDYTGTYEPYTGAGDYNPGDAFSISATANTLLGKTTCSADLGFSLFGTDVFEDHDVYKQGPQFNVRLSAVHPHQPFSSTVGARLVVRGRNARYNLSSGVIESQLKKYGNEFDLSYRIQYSTRADWQLGGLVGTRQIRASEEELKNSSIYIFGSDLGKTFADRWAFDLGLMYQRGSTDLNDTTISGFQVVGGFNVTY
jgi:hypothetical protein